MSARRLQPNLSQMYSARKLDHGECMGALRGLWQDFNDLTDGNVPCKLLVELVKDGLGYT